MAIITFMLLVPLNSQIIFLSKLMTNFKSVFEKCNLSESLVLHLSNYINYCSSVVFLSIIHFMLSLTSKSHHTNSIDSRLCTLIWFDHLSNHIFIVSCIEFDSKTIGNCSLALEFSVSNIKDHQLHLHLCELFFFSISEIACAFVLFFKLFFSSALSTNFSFFFRHFAYPRTLTLRRQETICFDWNVFRPSLSLVYCWRSKGCSISGFWKFWSFLVSYTVSHWMSFIDTNSSFLSLLVSNWNRNFPSFGKDSYFIPTFKSRSSLFPIFSGNQRDSFCTWVFGRTSFSNTFPLSCCRALALSKHRILTKWIAAMNLSWVAIEE